MVASAGSPCFVVVVDDPAAAAAASSSDSWIVSCVPPNDFLDALLALPAGRRRTELARQGLTTGGTGAGAGGP